MATSINADTIVGGAVVTGDASGQLELQAAGVTKLTVASSGVTLTSPLPVSSGGTGTSSTTYVNLASNVTGVLPVANGGTGSTSSTTLNNPFVKYDSLITLPAAIASSITADTLALTATTEIVFLQGSGNVFAVVWDNTAKAFGTPVLIRTATSAPVAASLISSTSVLVCTLASTSTALETVVLSISGTTITVNTPVATTLAANAQWPNTFKTRMTAVGSSYVIHYVETTTNTNNNYRAITVSGTVPTVGAQVTISAGGGVANISNVAYSSTIFLTMLASTSVLTARPISVSGSTLTLGTAATTSTTAGNVASGVLASGRVLIVYANNTLFATLASVSGTTASLTTGLNTTAALGSGPAIQVIGSQAFIGDANSSSGSAINVATDTAGVLSMGTATTLTNLNMFGFDGTNIYASQNSLAGGIFSFNIVGGSPSMNNVWGGSMAPTTNFGANYGVYNFNYANVENSSSLKTASGKYCLFSPTTSGFIPTFDTTNGYVLIFNNNINTTGITGNTQSSLDEFAGYTFSSNINLNTKVKIRRVELT